MSYAHGTCYVGVIAMLYNNCTAGNLSWYACMYIASVIATVCKVYITCRWLQPSRSVWLNYRTVWMNFLRSYVAICIVIITCKIQFWNTIPSATYVHIHICTICLVTTIRVLCVYGDLYKYWTPDKNISKMQVVLHVATYGPKLMLIIKLIGIFPGIDNI